MTKQIYTRPRPVIEALKLVMSAVASLAAGLLVACLILPFLSVESVEAIPDKVQPGKVYFVSKVGYPWKPGWTTRKEQLTKGTAGTYILDSAELTAAVGSFYQKPMAPAVKEQEVQVLPEPPLIRLTPQGINIAVRARVNTFFGLKLPVTIQMDGRVAKEGDHFVFVPTGGAINSLMLPSSRSVLTGVIEQVLRIYPLPEDLSKKWAMLSDFKVAEGKAHLTIP